MLSSNDGLMLFPADPLFVLLLTSFSTRDCFVSDDCLFDCDDALLLCVTVLRVVDGTDEEVGRFVDASS